MIDSGDELARIVAESNGDICLTLRTGFDNNGTIRTAVTSCFVWPDQLPVSIDLFESLRREGKIVLTADQGMLQRWQMALSR